MGREPRLQSDRIGIRACRWKYHPDFVEDLKRIEIDGTTWQAIKAMMLAAADGTARRVNWEYPCASSSGTVGELKYSEQGEVRYLDYNNAVVVEAVEIHYRVYFNEPTLCPEELWALSAGRKSQNLHFVSTDQQTDIEIAALRASQCSPIGSELHLFSS